MISFNNVHCTFGEDNAGIKNVDLNITDDDFIFLIGPTGSGKSTLLRLIYMDCFPEEGVVKIDNYKSDQLKKREIPELRRKVGMVFQDFRLLPDRTVYQNVALSLYIAHQTQQNIRSRVHEMLNKMDLGHRVHYMPEELSGGEKQRVAIARALIKDPIVILADEPTGNLDPRTSIEIIDELYKIHQDNNAVVVATHDYDLVERVPNSRIISIKNSEIKSIS